MIFIGFGTPSWLPFSTKIAKNAANELQGSPIFVQLRVLLHLEGTPGPHFPQFSDPWGPMFDDLFIIVGRLLLHFFVLCLFLLSLFPSLRYFCVSFFFPYLPSFVHSLLPFSVCSRLAWLAVGWIADGLVGSREAIRINSVQLK